MFNKIRLRIISGISFLLFLVTGFFGITFSMVNYGPPEVMAKHRDIGSGGLLAISSLVLLLISIFTLIISFFKKSR
jgi:hypothetical protein